MSARSATRVLFLPVLLLLVGATSCHRDHRGVGTIRILVTSAKGLGIEHCKRSVDPNEIWKTITIRDEDETELTRMTVRGRDAEVETRRISQIDGRRCILTAVNQVEAQQGVAYEITADGETMTLKWPGETIDDCYFHECVRYQPAVTVEFFARGEPGSAEVLAWAKQGTRCPDVLKDRGSAGIVALSGENLFCRVLSSFNNVDFSPLRGIEPADPARRPTASHQVKPASGSSWRRRDVKGRSIRGAGLGHPSPVSYPARMKQSPCNVCGLSARAGSPTAFGVGNC